MLKLGMLLLSITMVAISAAKTHGQEFTLTTTAANTVASKSTIGAPGLSGNPDAIIVATPVGGAETRNPHPIGAWYYNGKWNIFNTDHANMPAGLSYKLEIYPQPGPNQFVHVVTRESLSENSSYIDNPVLNGNPNLQVQILQNYAPDNRAYNLNANHAAATYNSASRKWYISNLNGKPLYPNTAYNVVVVGGIPDDSIRPLPVATTTTNVRIGQTGSEPTRRLPTQNIQTPAAAPADRNSSGFVNPLPKWAQDLIDPRWTNPPTGSTSAFSAPCNDAMARQTIGKWGAQKRDDLDMADRTFPKAQYKTVLAKAQEVIKIFMESSPQFSGIEASAYRGIRGQSIIPNGPVPFRVDVTYGSYICVGNDSATKDMRGKITLHGNYDRTTVAFNSLSDILESAQDGSPLLTTAGEEIFQYNKDLGEFRVMPLIQTSHRDSFHEAVIIATDGRMPFKPVTREEYLRARIRMYESGTGMRDVIAGLQRVLENMSPAERSAPAIVRDVTILPGGSRMFASESEGGRHLVTIDRSYFNPKLPRDVIQLITVHWNTNETDTAKIEMIREFKKDFDFESLKEMLGH